MVAEGDQEFEGKLEDIHAKEKLLTGGHVTENPAIVRIFLITFRIH